MARKEYELQDGVSVYDKDAGDYVTKKELVVDYKGQKGSTFLRGLQDKIFKYLGDMPKQEQDKEQEKDVSAEITSNDILDIVSISGNSADLYEAIINSLKTFGTIADKKCTVEMLDGLSEDDNDTIFEGIVEDFLSKKVIQRMKSMSK